MPRSIYCSTCKKEKEHGRENESRCFKCKSDAYKRNRLKKRLAKGLRPLGLGRNPNCYECGKLKENPKIGYCHACKRKQDNKWRLETGRTLRHRTGKCRCGNEFASFSGYQCITCYRKTRQEKRNNPIYKEQLYKDKVRSFTRSCIKQGLLTKGNCEMCGSTTDIEAHHVDYRKLFEVQWLCRKHHREFHQKDLTQS